MSNDSCPFCRPDASRVFFTGDHVIGLWDAFPVSAGHALLIPRRHVEDWFGASRDEQDELMRAVDIARATIEAKHRPDGYNIGINVGRAAGQTIFHLHVHVIPRYVGDVPDPRGGVRLVIPASGNYLLTGAASAVAEADPGDGTGGRGARLVRGGESDPLFAHLVACLDGARTVDLAVAFTMRTGVQLLEEHLRDVLDRGGRVRILTGDYLDVTEPAALLRLLDLQGDVAVRVFQSDGTSFHPKAFIVAGTEGGSTAFVGSSNLSGMALQRGIEWNYRVVTPRDADGFADIVNGFEALWSDPRATTVDEPWIRQYEKRRIIPPPRSTGVVIEPTGPPPEPHSVQAEALAALEATRAAGNTAGLVVLATGLGKTWLSAFDSHRQGFERILFIAHREEILTQAMRTYRRIRPMASLGYYTGKEKGEDADILFASIQTLSKRAHLQRFEPGHFDYIVVDEFHHAAAQSYRRVIGYFEPKFLLGLTATPERTDGGDLLALCGNNLVYRCDVGDGIQRGLLSPFAYHGVPDIVDYENIPWRGNRFDEEALTQHVATQARAENALQQHRRLAGKRTLAFCVSQRHADFMASYFGNAGLRAVAVHSGTTSAPRTHSLERLEAGELDVVFAVDMFNEGVDLPNIDTILLLRPTESRILWLQQFGRGLRFLAGKKLNVIDYIGNHRVFLTKTRALFDLGAGDQAVAYALDRLAAGTMELPPGCSVTYELETIEILRSLLRRSPPADRLRTYYEEFRESTGSRPLASEAFEDGLNPRSARPSFGSWLALVEAMDDLPHEHRLVRERIGALLDQLEVTPMTRSYTMLVLLAMIGADAFPGSIRIEELQKRFSDLARRYATIRNEVGTALDNPADLKLLLENNPIRAWAGGAGTGGTAYFRYADGVFETTFVIPDELRDAAQDLTRELAEWRLLEYLQRNPGDAGPDRFVCTVSHAGGRPILFLPGRDKNPHLPSGWQTVIADDKEYLANFVKIALNVATRPGSDENVLPDILRNWFGRDAGQPGRSDAVFFERRGDAYMMSPATDADRDFVPVLWQRYSKADGAAALGTKLKGMEQQMGIVRRPGMLIFFVTLDKQDMQEAHKYKDQFLSPADFQWQSQNQNRQDSDVGRDLVDAAVQKHLFVRRTKKVRGRTEPFRYCGTLEFRRWEGERPITVWWRLAEAVPERFWDELGVPERGVEPG
jgi:superfamily II DNA or RNA helicase/HKD family nuclease/diadenosine tetraphosphate (Ap4A) HIT family hydrolase